MISYQQALDKVIESAQPLSTLKIAAQKASGHYLAEPLCAPFSLPRFDNTAVDGYGVRANDFCEASDTNPIPLIVITTIRAGATWQGELPKQGVVKILTGAPIPIGVDAVIMREEVESPEGVFVKRQPRVGENIRFAGEELAADSTVLLANTFISPGGIGLLYTFGIQAVQVFRKPRVALIATGDELLTGNESLSDGKIYDSNSPALAATLNAIGIKPIRLRIVSDERETLRHTLVDVMKRADIVITIGGVSVGEYDLIREVTKQIGVREVFWKAAIKPGKPLYFGTYGNKSQKLFFGLPGNPVAAMVTFELFAIPAIRKMMGAHECNTEVLQGVLTETIRKKSGRMEFSRAVANWNGNGYRITPVGGQESHMLSGFAKANCLLHFPLELSELSAGSTVDFQFYSSSQTGVTK